MEPLAALGRPRADFATPGVDFEGSPKWVDFWRLLEAPKSRWMLALGRLGGAKNAPGDGQELGEGVRFEKRVPRAASRARLINKLIRLKELTTIRII